MIKEGVNIKMKKWNFKPPGGSEPPGG